MKTIGTSWRQVFLTLTLLLCGFHARAEWQIVSDYDDTIKKTHVQSTPRAIAGAFSEKFFGGVSELISQLHVSLQAPVHVLSNSPSALNLQVRKALRENQVPFQNVFLRNVFRDSGPRHKSRVLRDLATRHSRSNFFLMGDNVEKDPDIYERFIDAEFKYDSVILIHRVRGDRDDRFPSHFSYSTAFEAAQILYDLEIFSADHVRAVAKSMRDLGPKEILPYFVSCPLEQRKCEFGEADLNGICRDIQRQVMSRCGG